MKESSASLGGVWLAGRGVSCWVPSQKPTGSPISGQSPLPPELDWPAATEFWIKRMAGGQIGRKGGELRQKMIQQRAKIMPRVNSIFHDEAKMARSRRSGILAPLLRVSVLIRRVFPS